MLSIVGQRHDNDHNNSNKMSRWLTVCCEEVKRLINIQANEHIPTMLDITQINGENIKSLMNKLKRALLLGSLGSVVCHC